MHSNTNYIYSVAEIIRFPRKQIFDCILGSGLILDGMDKLKFQEQLINEVQRHQHLYVSDASKLGYQKKSSARDNSWQEIALKLKSDVDICRKTWQSLRRRFAIAKNKGAVSLSPILARMEWLSPHVKHRSKSVGPELKVSLW